MAILKSLIVNGVARVIGDLTASKIIKQGGVSSLFLKADGSVDSNAYIVLTSSARPGVTKLYRRDVNDGYNVLTLWDGTYWILLGYYEDTYHAPCRVSYADNADTARDATLHNGYTIVQTNGLTSTIRNFTLGTLVRTSIDYSVTEGDSFYVEIKGNTYSEALYSCFTQIQGYIYDDTIIAYGVTHLGVLKITPITAMNLDGKLCFWFPRLGYWMGFDIRCYTGRNYAINTVTSIEDSADPGGTKRVTLTANEITSYHSGNLTASVIGNLGTLSNNISGNAATATSALDTDKLDGYHATYGNNKPWGTIPVITTGGWMDVGKHFEFHYDNTTGSDFSTALMCSGNYGNVVNLPSASGTLALTSQIPTSLPANGGNADTVDNEHSSAFAHVGAHNNLTASGNEFTFASSGFSGSIWLNYRTAGGANGNITEYKFGNGKGGELGTAIHSGNIGSQSVNYANSAGTADTSSYPAGFNLRLTSTWATTGWNMPGTWITGWGTDSGADIAFAKNGGALNVATDGYFYQGADYGHGLVRVMDDWDRQNTIWGDADTLDGNHASAFAAAGHTHDGRYLRYEGWWNSGSGQNVDDANGMTFVYGNHGSPNGWGILCTFDYTYNSGYKFQLFAEGYHAAGMYYRCRSEDRGGWTSWKTVIDSGNIGSQSVSHANSAESAIYLTPQSYTAINNTVGGHKAGLANWLNNDSSTGIGKHVIVGASIINQWDNDSATYYDSSVYAMIKIGGGYNYSTYGLWLLSSYNQTRLGVVGRDSNTWSSIKWIAWTSDIPTSLPANGGNADTVDNQHFSYSNDSNSPTYLWATNSNGTSFLAARTSLSVNYASSAGAVTVTTSNSASTYNILFNNGNVICSNTTLTVTPSSGNVTSSGHFYANSDIRYKNIIEHHYSLSDKIAQLPIIKYKWTDRDDDSIRIGSSALSVMNIIPELVSYDNNTDFYSLDYATLGAVAGISACKEVEMLKLKIKELELEIIILKSKYNG